MLHRPHHTLGNQEVHVWHLLTDELADLPMLDAIEPLLSPDEQTRLTRVVRSRDRLLFAMSRAVMRTVLASYLDCPCQELRFTANGFGKPILQAECGAPPLHFNLTHSHGAIALAVSREREVGVDVEDHHRKVDYLPLAERYFAATEARHLHQLCEAKRREAFFAIWTLKEAFVKGIGRGLSFPLDAFCFDLESNRLIGFRPLADFVSPDWHFRQFELGRRHCGAVAVNHPACQAVHIEMREWSGAFLSCR